MYPVYRFVYLILFIIGVPVYSIIRFVKGKPGIRWKYRLGHRLRKITEIHSSPVWIHAVSVGEVLAAKPLVLQLRESFPSLPIVMSITTETGKIAAEDLPYDTYIIDFPFDFKKSVRKYIENVNPQMVIIMETELWPVFCTEVNKKDIPLILLNGRISDTSYPKYKFIKSLMKRVLRCFSLLIVQTELYKERLISLGADESKIIVYKSLKYHLSNFLVESEESDILRKELALSEKDILITAGSTHKGEEEQVIYAFKKLKKEYPILKLAIVPRRPERFNAVWAMINDSGFIGQRFSSSQRIPDWDIVLVDKMGELKRFYSISSLVFVGGSFIKHGGQNLLEPAAFGVPVLYGPHIYNFAQMSEMLNASGGGCIVKDADALYSAMRNLISDEQKRKITGEKAKSVIEANQKDFDELFKNIEKRIKC
ncbi:MAG: 3-deoxy-D-manno-octulosonic acid transferase [Acidobacteria bacterium]|nr:3-deoxy-D-manno-octulosonic acid transferase [Acidobacteriota bacterium]